MSGPMASLIRAGFQLDQRRRHRARRAAAGGRIERVPGKLGPRCGGPLGQGPERAVRRHVAVADHVELVVEHEEVARTPLSAKASDSNISRGGRRRSARRLRSWRAARRPCRPCRPGICAGSCRASWRRRRRAPSCAPHPLLLFGLSHGQIFPVRHDLGGDRRREQFGLVRSGAPCQLRITEPRIVPALFTWHGSLSVFYAPLPGVALRAGTNRRWRWAALEPMRARELNETAPHARPGRDGDPSQRSPHG